MPEVNAELLRRCTRCEETIYPDPARPRDGDRRCRYCDGRLSN